MYEKIFKADWEDEITLTKDDIVDLCEISRLFKHYGYLTYIINQFGMICMDERVIVYAGILEKINTDLYESIEELMEDSEKMLILISEIIHKERKYFMSNLKFDPVKIVKADLEV